MEKTGISARTGLVCRHGQHGQEWYAGTDNTVRTGMPARTTRTGLVCRHGLTDGTCASVPASRKRPVPQAGRECRLGHDLCVGTDITDMIFVSALAGPELRHRDVVCVSTTKRTGPVYQRVIQENCTGGWK